MAFFSANQHDDLHLNYNQGDEYEGSENNQGNGPGWNSGGTGGKGSSGICGSTVSAVSTNCRTSNGASLVGRAGSYNRASLVGRASNNRASLVSRAVCLVPSWAVGLVSCGAVGLISSRAVGLVSWALSWDSWAVSWTVSSRTRRNRNFDFRRRWRGLCRSFNWWVFCRRVFSWGIFSWWIFCWWVFGWWVFRALRSDCNCLLWGGWHWLSYDDLSWSEESGIFWLVIVECVTR